MMFPSLTSVSVVLLIEFVLIPGRLSEVRRSAVKVSITYGI
jgi:hypothetical protein